MIDDENYINKAIFTKTENKSKKQLKKAQEERLEAFNEACGVVPLKDYN